MAGFLFGNWELVVGNWGLGIGIALHNLQTYSTFSGSQSPAGNVCFGGSASCKRARQSLKQWVPSRRLGTSYQRKKYLLEKSSI